VIVYILFWRGWWSLYESIVRGLRIAAYILAFDYGQLGIATFFLAFDYRQLWFVIF